MKFRLALFLIFISGFSFAQSLNHVLIPGTSFYMIPPPGFEAADGFKGFLHPSTGALIMVNEIEAPYDLILGRFSKEALEIKKMTLVGRQDLKLNNADATLISATQTEEGIENFKKMLLFGEEQKTLLVTAVYPESNPELGAGMKRALLSTVYKQPIYFGHLSAVGFNLKMAGSSFKLSRCIDSTLVFTPDGKLPTTGAFLIAQKKTEQVEKGLREQYCLDRLKMQAETDSLLVKATTETIVDGMSGLEIIAERKAKSGRAELVYQTIVFDKKAVNYSIFGVAPEKNEKDVNYFRSISASLKRGPYRTRVPEETGDTVTSYWYAGLMFDDYRETTAERAQFRREISKDNGRWTVNSFYESGERELKAICLDDSLKVREGLCRRWHKNGQLADSTYYANGKLEGHQTWYYENGQKSEEGTYRAGEPKNVLFWTENGLPDTNGVAGVKTPTFKGDSLMNYLVHTLVYPESARNFRQQGKSVIRFKITEEGKVTEAHVLRTSGVRELDNEALRAIELMPDWNPASNHNRKSRMDFTMPITFRLD